MEKNYILNGYHIRLFVDLEYGYRDIKITKNDKVIDYYTDENYMDDGLEEKANDMVKAIIEKNERDKIQRG